MLQMWDNEIGRQFLEVLVVRCWLPNYMQLLHSEL